MTTNWREKLEAKATNWQTPGERLFLPVEDALAILERAYNEGRADANSALEEIHIMAAADGPAEFLATQRRRIGQLAIDALAAARGTP